MPSPQPDVILTRAEVAEWLKVKPRQVERLGIPCLDLGRKTKRYIAREVYDWLQAKRAGRGGPWRNESDRTSGHSGSVMFPLLGGPTLTGRP